MSVESVEVIDPGLLATVQDRGRYGYQRYGVPVSGAMDSFALRAANILVGNDEGAAGLEMAVLGPKMRFLRETWIAVTGADLSATLDGEPAPLWESVRVSKGGVLSFQRAQDGMRAYLAVAGGIEVPVMMGSRSTYLKGAIGGLEGRALKTGDVLCACPLEPNVEFVKRRLPALAPAPSYGHQHEVRVILGPQDRAFTSNGVATFLSSPYTVSIQSDRMGYRLEGPTIERESGSDIVSDGTPLGAVQVPGDGRPIILLADRGTTGGYAKIATVISADIPKLAQAMPGDTVTFKPVTIEQAHAALWQQEDMLKAIRADSAIVGPTGRLSITVDGQAFEVMDEAGQAITLPNAVDEHGGGDRHRLGATVGGRRYEFQVEVRREG